MPDHNLIVWRRSFPHNARWPDINQMYETLQQYNIFACVTTRDVHAMAKSQIRARHVQTYEEAITNMQVAYPLIFSGLHSCNIPFTTFSYEALIARHERYLEKMFNILELPTPKNFEDIFDANEKYYL